MMTEDEEAEHLAEMRALFGDGQTEDYLAILKATASLLNIAQLYYMADEGSVQEAIAKDVLEATIDKFRKHPDKAIDMLESLLALVCHVQVGGTVGEWFGRGGIVQSETTIDEGIVNMARKEET